MKILHICNWASGITTRNINALKQHSIHSHELAARIQHPYDIGYEAATYTEATTTADVVLQLAEEADVLQFHAVGSDGTAAHPETIHDINWSQFLGRKVFIGHGMCSILRGESFLPVDDFIFRDLSKYDVLFGSHLSCKQSYEERLRYVPDMIPIWDWLYMPAAGPKQNVACTFKDIEAVRECSSQGVDLRLLPTPSQMSAQLNWRRKTCKATFDNYTDGHWGLFGIESLAQGIPCVAYTHPVDIQCWRQLEVNDPPFLPAQGPKEVAEQLRYVFNLPDNAWQDLSKQCRSWVTRYYDPFDLVDHWDMAYNEILYGR